MRERLDALTWVLRRGAMLNRAGAALALLAIPAFWSLVYILSQDLRVLIFSILATIFTTWRGLDKVVMATWLVAAAVKELQTFNHMLSAGWFVAASTETPTWYLAILTVSAPALLWSFLLEACQRHRSRIETLNPGVT